MLLYIHVPFCRAKCRYCAFHSVPLGRHVKPAECAALRDYVDTLFMEMAIWGDRLGPKKVSSIFIGGGTPSLLPPRILDLLLEKAAACFHVEKGAEITMEANPESLVNAAQAAACLRAGVNRISLGVQSLDDAMLRVLGRAHHGGDVLRTVSAVRDAGCVNLNLDLMWALPGQSVRHWLNTLKEVLRLRPDHISAYALTLEEGTPLEKEVSRGRLSLPEEREQSLMFLEGAAQLESAGYLHYEISNFARMGFACRHNVGYWEGREYLGLGPSATSTLGDRRWTNPADQQVWTEAVAQRRLGEHAEVLTPEVRVLELIMLRLRTARGLRLKAYRQLTGCEFVPAHAKLVQALHENGLIRIRDGYLRLTRHGMLVSNSIISSIFEQTEKVLQHRAPAPLEHKEAPAAAH